MRPVILFDLDGTLIDSIDLIVSSFDHTRKVHFGDELPRSYWISTIGVTAKLIQSSGFPTTLWEI